MKFYTDPQGSEEWLAARRAVVTASRFRDCRDKLKSGAPSKACLSYAMDVARERCGGVLLPMFANAAMRMGSEQEQFARQSYEAATGEFVEEVGLACTDDRKFGVSVDGLIGTDGIYECKTMVSSDTLFTVIVDGDISAYVDQCNGAMWLLGRQWVDLHLWVADLPALSRVIRIERNDDAIEALEADLMKFEALVSKFEAELRARMKRGAEIPDDVLDEEPDGNAATVAELPAAPSAAAPAPTPAPAPAPKPAQAAPGPVAIPLDIFG